MGGLGTYREGLGACRKGLAARWDGVSPAGRASEQAWGQKMKMKMKKMEEIPICV